MSTVRPFRNAYDVSAEARAVASAPIPSEWYGAIAPVLTGNWCVKKLVPTRGLVVIYGIPGCGKSFLALDLGLHIATAATTSVEELDWMDRRVKGGLVIYIAAEGQTGQRLRVEAFRKAHPDFDDLPFLLVPVGLDLLHAGDESDLQRLIGRIRYASDEFNGLPVAAIFVDTMSRTFGGGDENGPDMAQYVANLGILEEEFSCAVIGVHHQPEGQLEPDATRAQLAPRRSRHDDLRGRHRGRADGDRSKAKGRGAG